MTTCSSLTSCRKRFAAGLKCTLAQLSPARPGVDAANGNSPKEQYATQTAAPVYQPDRK